MTYHPLFSEIRSAKNNCPGPADSEPAPRGETFPSRRRRPWSLDISGQMPKVSKRQEPGVTRSDTPGYLGSDAFGMTCRNVQTPEAVRQPGGA